MSAERFDPEGTKEPKEERRQAEITRAPEIGAGNGCRALKSPRIGLETETERRSPGSNGSAKVFGGESKVQDGNVDPEMVRKRHCGRAKDRIEIPAPVKCEGYRQRLRH